MFVVTIHARGSIAFPQRGMALCVKNGLVPYKINLKGWTFFNL